MKLVINLFIFMAMGLLVVGVAQKFFNTVIIFPNISALAHVVFANSCLLIALILKLVND